MIIRVIGATTVLECVECKGQTVVSAANDYVYDTDKFTCNCIPDGELFGKADLDALMANPDLENDEAHPNSNAKTAQAEQRENPNQAKMFDEDKTAPLVPEDVVGDDVMTRGEVSAHLKGLKWQELLNSASTNGIKKQPNVNREQLEEMILDKVFGDSDTVIVEPELDEDGTDGTSTE